MSLLPNAEALIRKNLEAIARGNRPAMVVIGKLTPSQLEEINANRASLRNPAPPIQAEIVFIGRHLYGSRVEKDGYTIDEVILQILNALSDRGRYIRTLRATLIQDMRGRVNTYGERVKDQAVLECSAKYPRPELLSVIPKGEIGPNERKAAASATAHQP